MKVALIGASGFVGKAVLNELLQRGHQVLAIVRNPENNLGQAGMTVWPAVCRRAGKLVDAAFDVWPGLSKRAPVRNRHGRLNVSAMRFSLVRKRFLNVPDRM